MQDLDYVKQHINDIRKELFDFYTLTEKKLRGNSKYIYLLRSRIKSPESAFLKLRRKNNQSISDLTDLLGLRAYCLYDDDIINAHVDIMKYLYDNKCFIKKINIYGSNEWEKGKFQKFVEKACECLDGHSGEKNEIGILKEIIYKYNNKKKVIQINYTDKSSGYKSIHYIFEMKIGKKYIKCELQLRTILQDVWAEIENNISYKKSNVHPHTKKLFDNLSHSLIDVQKQIETIREIQNDEHRWNNFFYDKVKQVFLHYDEKNLIDVDGVMNTIGATGLYHSYVRIASNDNIGKRSKDDIKKLKRYLSDIKEKAKNIEIDKLSYFFKMENAFIFMLQGEITKASKIYEYYIKEINSSNDMEELYSVFFKYGEIKYINGDIQGSFISFDKCERLMESMPHADPENKFFIYERLASIYWSLGTDYYEIALEKIKKSKEVYDNNKNLCSNNVFRLILFNKLCWHNLSIVEKYIIPNIDNKISPYRGVNDDIKIIIINCMKEANIFYKEMVSLYEKNNDSFFQNMLDTMAWYCYLKSQYINRINPGKLDSLEQKEEAEKWIIKSLNWSEEIIKDHIENRGINPLRSINLHQRHIQDILKEKTDNE